MTLSELQGKRLDYAVRTSETRYQLYFGPHTVSFDADRCTGGLRAYLVQGPTPDRVQLEALIGRTLGHVSQDGIYVRLDFSDNFGAAFDLMSDLVIETKKEEASDDTPHTVESLVRRLEQIAAREDESFGYKVEIEVNAQGRITYRFIAYETAERHPILEGTGVTPDAAAYHAARVYDPTYFSRHAAPAAV